MRGSVTIPDEEADAMSEARPEPLRPLAVGKEGADGLFISWNDGHRSVYTWQHLRRHCPCAGCRGEHERPPDPLPRRGQR